ncbi:hypothetical protein QTP88_006150 [Uroleucon formosanum]
MTLVNEKRNGFSSNFVFKCLICGVFENIYLEDPDRKDVDINMAITSAVINTGQGYSQLDEFTAVLDMPCYANSSYQKYHEKLYSNLFDASVDETRLAGIEEAKLAIQNGEVDNQGRALVTVVADGDLSKRSYKTNYNASSGVASIIGYRMKKCLFMSVRNKYCVICERALNTKQIVREHKCYKNWTSTSTSTEANTIKSMLYKTFCGNEHTIYGIECEPFAKTEFQKLKGLKIQESGLFIYERLPFLAASPDGLLYDNGIVEIKCPSTIKQLTPKEAIGTGKLKFATIDNQGNLQLKKSDKYYFQVMGQLQIIQRLFCYFIIWSPKGNYNASITNKY